MFDALALCYLSHNPVAQCCFFVLKVVKQQEIPCTVTETKRGRFVGVSNTSCHKRPHSFDVNATAFGMMRNIEAA